MIIAVHKEVERTKIMTFKSNKTLNTMKKWNIHLFNKSTSETIEYCYSEMTVINSLCVFTRVFVCLL
jgi:hypothetical protein